MDYGLYISSSGLLTSLYRQDVLTNNLSNADTPGFRHSLAAARQRDPARVEDSLWQLPSSELLEKLGAGLLLSPTRISTQQGPLQTTGNDLDAAIMGDGYFLVRDDADQSGQYLRLTRDGRFTRSAESTLVRATDGKAILDESQRPITLPDAGQITIDADGVIRADGEVVARLALVDTPQRDRLLPTAGGLLKPDADIASSLEPATGSVRQHAIEGSTVDPVKAMMDMTGASRAAQANIGMITYHDQAIERAISLGRVNG
ncbi:MAG: flagellar hook basal-body protein [Phycisphaeraceae bacterium]|nr:flagellar hook basal-body protein [Phycisphaeraceae bacterium]